MQRVVRSAVEVPREQGHGFCQEPCVANAVRSEERRQQVAKFVGDAPVFVCDVSDQAQIDRLAEDHRRARRLAEEVSEMPGMTIDLEAVQTNMIYVRTALPAPQVAKQLEEVGVLCIPLGPGSIRLVTHHDITDEDIDHAIDGFWNAG